MVTPFAFRDEKLSAAIDRAFGESFEFSGYITSGDVDAPFQPDAARPTFSANGVFEAASKSRTPHARGSVQDDNAHNWAVSAPSISVADANCLWPLRRGDRALRLFDGSTFEVSSALPDAMGRTVLILSARKRAVPVYSPSLDFSDVRNSQYLGQVV